jgi:NAD(P)-dependent dehydrogenase (short-subunit alcohol dehydrogenase family)
VVTGGAGLLGDHHCDAIAAAGGIPVVVDLDGDRAKSRASVHSRTHGVAASGVKADITDRNDVERILEDVLSRYGRLDGLVNNAANNPKVEGDGKDFSRLEAFPLPHWDADLAVGLTGAFLCSQVLGGHLAGQGSGSIVNISSEYGMLGPDQRLYHRDGVADDEQPVKPITYSVVKAGLDGMTRWLATYWAEHGVRVNTLTVGGVQNGQPDEFVARAASRVPLGRMAMPHEYRGAVVFLLSDASTFMTGANLVVDGGKSTW